MERLGVVSVGLRWRQPGLRTQPHGSSCRARPCRRLSPQTRSTHSPDGSTTLLAFLYTSTPHIFLHKTSKQLRLQGCAEKRLERSLRRSFILMRLLSNTDTCFLQSCFGDEAACCEVARGHTNTVMVTVDSCCCCEAGAKPGLAQCAHAQ